MTPRPQPFVLSASEHGPMIVNRMDFHQLPSGATYGVGHQILSQGAYDPDEVAHVCSLLDKIRSDKTRKVLAVDCGANIGVHTVSLAKHMAEWGNVISFEAQERLYYALCGNIALNNCFNAEAHHCALGSEHGSLDIPQPNYFRPGSFGSLELVRGENTEYIGQSISYAARDLRPVTLAPLDYFLGNLPHVDFIKIDVEGMELAVLQGAREVLRRHRPTMLIEWIKCGQDRLRAFLADFDYEAILHGPNILFFPQENKNV